MQIPKRSNSIGVVVLALISAALLLSGCGGSSSSSQKGATAQESNGSRVISGSGSVVAGEGGATVGAPGHSDSDPTAQALRTRRDPVTGGKVTQVGKVASDSFASRQGLEGNAKPRVQNPCALVTRSEIRQILGATVASETEAPLGPTCVVKLHEHRSVVSLAVEQLSFAKLGSQVKEPQKLAVADHPGLCGTLGRPMLFVSIRTGSVLNVTAPCGVAKALATKAISRLEG